MIDDHSKASQSPLRLAPKQSAVLDLLKGLDTEEYPLSNWYLGALYAVANTPNPERFSQAAQSLRELMEKLPRVMQNTDVQANLPDFKQQRIGIHARFQDDKNNYKNSWKGKEIDSHLGETLAKIDGYLELSQQQPTRREQSQKAMESTDPLSNRLDAKTRKRKRDKFHHLWGVFESIVHHKSFPDKEKFDQYREELEDIILDLLAPVTGQDQLEIQSILNRRYQTQDDVKRLFSLVERTGANYIFFFKRVSNPSWMDDLNRRGYFSDPPGIEILSETRVNFPYWAPIDYLIRIANQHTKSVVDTVLEMGDIDNLLILNGIAKIALKATPIEQSLRLKEYVTAYMDSPYIAGQSSIIPKLIERWFGESDDATNEALELVGKIISFQPDPGMEEKISRHEKNPDDWTTILNPTPRFISGNYHKFLKNNICPLAKKSPWKLASILIDEVARMNRLYHYPADSDPKTRSDYSQVWCPRLGKLIWKHDSSEQAIINTLTYACGTLYKLAPEHIGKLNEKLANQPWPLFKRLRQYLCAHNLTAQTKPWIRELILNHPGYARWDYPYDFQKMLRRACERFGGELLTKEERTEIFEAIQSGPSEDACRTVLGDKFTEDIFRQRRQKFHQMQFQPFVTVLFGKYLDYFKELEATLNEPISDEDYSPVPEVESRTISYRSPRSPEDLANLHDKELLDYINKWQGQHDLELDRTMEVSIHALSGAFQTVFMETIIPDETRLSFWLENRDRIQRPIYIRVMIDAMQENVKAKKFVHIDRWLDFCQWVLARPDSHSTETFPFGEESREAPGWTRSRRSVVDFIAACVDKNADTPISARSGLANLLQSLCTQPDWTLDQEEHESDDLASVAINRTRGRALDSLVAFGFWIRRHKPHSDVSEIATILNDRFHQNETLPITLPEYAILGFHYSRITMLNPTWAQAHKADIFPHDNFPAWRAAFSASIRYIPAGKQLYSQLQGEYRFAIEHFEKLPPEQHKYDVDTANLEELIPKLQERENRRNEIISRLGRHLFIYYLWGMFPSGDNKSLFNLFYEKTRGNPGYWRDLFDYAGRLLKAEGETWGDKMIAKAMEFFDWRSAERNPEELQEFFYLWLEAECLPAKWRLDALSQVLGICQPGARGVMHGVPTLAEMLEEHSEKVVECFSKMTDLLPHDDYIYIDIGKAEMILKSGFDSTDENTYQHAKYAHDKLLRHGYSIFSG